MCTLILTFTRTFNNPISPQGESTTPNQKYNKLRQLLKQARLETSRISREPASPLIPVALNVYVEPQENKSEERVRRFRQAKDVFSTMEKRVVCRCCFWNFKLYFVLYFHFVFCCLLYMCVLVLFCFLFVCVCVCCICADHHGKK